MDRPECTSQSLLDDRPRDARSGVVALGFRWPLSGPIARYPSHYCWLILAGTLDIVVTYCVLQLGGAEVNPLALAWLQLLGHWGLVVLKYTSLVIVIAICEMIARRQVPAGRRLAEWAVVIAALPVVLGLAQIAGHP